ncbi:hydroxymethylbilane synthase, partial [Candidatus Poribacteria bacterium]
YSDSVTQQLPYDICLPAVGQGALCIEIRAEDSKVRDIVRSIDNPESAAPVNAERALLRKLGGGCHVPIAALGVIEPDGLHLEGLVADPDGQKLIRSNASGRQDEAELIGERLADLLLSMGAESILATGD